MKNVQASNLGPNFAKDRVVLHSPLVSFTIDVMLLLRAKLVVKMQVNIIVPPPVFRSIFLETPALPANTLNFLGLTS